MAISRPITRSTARKIVFRGCRALRFNGVNNYGQLATRAINPEGDNVFEFYVTATSPLSGHIIFQSLQVNNPDREFSFFIRSNGQGVIAFGGATFDTAVFPINFRSEGKFKVEILASQIIFYFNDSVVINQPFTRGVIREPGAVTTIMARTTSGIVNSFALGLLPYIRINNQYWAMDAVGQTTQPSLPAGNNMTLFNVTPEQWEPIACSLRP